MGSRYLYGIQHLEEWSTEGPTSCHNFPNIRTMVYKAINEGNCITLDAVIAYYNRKTGKEPTEREKKEIERWFKSFKNVLIESPSETGETQRVPVYRDIEGRGG